MDNLKAIEFLEYIEAFFGMNSGETKIALDQAINSLKKEIRIKEILSKREAGTSLDNIVNEIIQTLDN